MPRKGTVWSHVYLAKEEITSDEEALKDPTELTALSLTPGLPFTGTLYLKKQGRPYQPKWWNFLKPNLASPPKREPRQTSASAVLLIHAERRVFAFTYGYGRTLLEQSKFERDFGLKVVLNTVDPKSLRSIDCHTIEDVTIQTRSQASRNTTLGTFGIDVAQDLVRQIVGTPKDPELGSYIAGSDGLALAAKMEFPELEDKCGVLLGKYQCSDYKEQFPFIDNIRSIRDTVQRDHLDTLLQGHLQDGTVDNMSLVPPEIVDWSDIGEFVFGAGQSTGELNDLDLDSWLQEASKVHLDLDCATLKHTKMGILKSSDGSKYQPWNVYDFLAAEIEDSGALFELCCGTWYEVKNDYATRIHESVKELAAVSSPELPPMYDNEREEIYNERASGKKNYALCDQKCVRIDGDSIEPCDLFTRDGAFIHVKKRNASATLSHLFAQGLVSADCFLGDSTFRKDFHLKLKQTGKAGFEDCFSETGRPNPGDFKVVYAIATDTRRSHPWPLSLPFFSQVNLSNTNRHLKNLGFSVALTKIEVIHESN